MTTRRILIRRDTAANWTASNPTLASGELGGETDTGKLKLGNGSTAWNSLAYQGGVTSVNGNTGVVTGLAPTASPTFTGTVTIPSGASISGFAPLASPTFTGTVTLPTGTVATTQTAANNTTAVATTAYVDAAVSAGIATVDTLDDLSDVTAPTPTSGDLLKWNGTAWVNAAGYALLASPTFTGTPTLPTGTIATTQTAANSTTAVATTAFVTTADNLKANIASPTFTGTVSGVTATMVGLGSVDNTADTAKPVSTAQQTALDLKANLASPTFTGTPTLPTGTIATTQTASDSTTKVATTAFVTTADNLKANIASPTFTGVPAAPTAAVATNTTQIATTAFVRAEVAALVGTAGATLDTLGEIATALGNDANLSTTLTTSIGLKAPLASPALTGTPTAPTAAVGTNTTQIATTAFVAVQASPIGMITAFAGSTAPTGWQLCYGQAISRTTYANLFSVLGTTYGLGDGSTTFNLPDLRGRTVAGVDNMGGTDAGRLSTANTLGTTTGTETVTLTSAQSGVPAHAHANTVTNNAVTSGNQSADHSHTFTTGIESANHTHGINDARTFWGENDTLDWTLANGGNISFKRYNPFDQTSDGVSANHTHSGTTAGMNVSHTHSVTSNVSISNVNNTAADAASAHSNMQPTMTINYIILAGA